MRYNKCTILTYLLAYLLCYFHFWSLAVLLTVWLVQLLSLFLCWANNDSFIHSRITLRGNYRATWSANEWMNHYLFIYLLSLTEAYISVSAVPLRFFPRADLGTAARVRIRSPPPRSAQLRYRSAAHACVRPLGRHVDIADSPRRRRIPSRFLLPLASRPSPSMPFRQRTPPTYIGRRPLPDRLAFSSLSASTDLQSLIEFPGRSVRMFSHL